MPQRASSPPPPSKRSERRIFRCARMRRCEHRFVTLRELWIHARARPPRHAHRRGSDVPLDAVGARCGGTRAFTNLRPRVVDAARADRAAHPVRFVEKFRGERTSPAGACSSTALSVPTFPASRTHRHSTVSTFSAASAGGSGAAHAPLELTRRLCNRFQPTSGACLICIVPSGGDSSHEPRRLAPLRVSGGMR